MCAWLVLLLVNTDGTMQSKSKEGRMFLCFCKKFMLDSEGGH